jgi:hypothetical protein
VQQTPAPEKPGLYQCSGFLTECSGILPSAAGG